MLGAEVATGKLSILTCLGGGRLWGMRGLRGCLGGTDMARRVVPSCSIEEKVKLESLENH